MKTLCRNLIGTYLGILMLTGCSLPWKKSAPPPSSPLKILVGPITVTAPVSKSSHIHSFDKAPADDAEPALLAQLIEEVEVRAQRTLIEELSKRIEFKVVSFDESQRLVREASAGQRHPSEEQLVDAGRKAETAIVLTGQIHDYGRLQWRHWATGWLSVVSVHTTIVGALSGWNPIAMGGYFTYDLLTDLPLWYGGAYVFGWAFRPVHVELEGTQLAGCQMQNWDEGELVILSGKALKTYPTADRKRKEIQLKVNLEQALMKLSVTAGEQLRLKPCPGTDIESGLPSLEDQDQRSSVSF